MNRVLNIISCLLLLSGNAFGLNPSKTYKATPKDYGMNYEEVNIQTEDKLILKGWFFNNKQTPAKVIVLSDDGDGNMADMIEIASNFISLGYNVLTYDYRGYGKSADFEINPKFYIYSQFEKDLNAALDFVKKYHSACKIVHLYGLGLGAGLSIATGANRPEVSRVIADSPYLTFESIQKQFKEVKNIEVLLPMGYNKVTMEPKYALEEKGVQLTGLLLIAGEQNDLYTTKMIKELSKIKGGISSVYIVKGTSGNITENFASNKSSYFEEIRKFLK
jgi:uncharacterized protein